MRKSRIEICCILAALLLCATPTLGQLTAGSVSGNVFDSSGAPMSNVSVVLQNSETGVSSDTVTNESGIFTFPTIPVGRYSFTANLKGFKTAVGTLQVQLNLRTSVAITLQVGEVTQKVEVSSVVAPVETTSTQITDTFSESQVTNLPLASVDVNRLALLGSGVADINTVGLTRGQSLQQVSTVVGGSVGAIGGSRARNNNFVIDGVDDNDPINTGPQTFVIQDAVQEFSLTKNNFDAEYGQFSGGLFNIVTKTGTNKFHGNAYLYNQNRNYNATDAITQAGIASGSLSGNPRFDYNRIGGTIGGPVVRDKLFFFAAYEHEGTGASSLSSTTIFPTAAGYTLLASLPPGISKSGTPASVSPFILNFLSQFGATASAASDPSIWPVVLGTPIPVGPVTNAIATFANNNRLLVSSDWIPGVSDQFHFRFTYNRGPDGILAGAPLASLNANERISNYLASIGYTHTFSPTLLNEVHVSYHRQLTDFAVVDPSAQNIPNIVIGEIPLNIGPPGSVPSGSFNDIYQLLDDVSLQKGRHLFKFGVDLRSNIVTDISNVTPRGDYDYVNFEDFVTDIPPTVSGERGAGGTHIALNNHEINWYAQDQFKWTHNLTVYLGIRYEYNSLLRDMATQSEEAIANVPGVITFGKPTVSKNDWGRA